MDRQQLCTALRTQWYLESDEIDTIFADWDFFCPYLKQALARRAQLGGVPHDEDPVDATDANGVFLLAHKGEVSILPDLLRCLRFHENDVVKLYSDALTEDLWLPIAQIAYDKIEELWDFVSDDSVYWFSRLAVINGLLAMAVLSPETRPRVVRFIERMLDEREKFGDQELGGILCDCGDHGLNELQGGMEKFVETMEEPDHWLFLQCTREDVANAFQGTLDSSTKKRLKGNVYSINELWKRHIVSQEEEEKRWTRRDEKERKNMERFLPQHVPRRVEKIGRNDPCPCGSGRKYKKCCSVEAQR